MASDFSGKVMPSTAWARSRSGRASRRSISTTTTAMPKPSTPAQNPGGKPSMLKASTPPVVTISVSPVLRATAISTEPGEAQASALSGPANSSCEGSTLTRTLRPPSAAR